MSGRGSCAALPSAPQAPRAADQSPLRRGGRRRRRSRSDRSFASSTWSALKSESPSGVATITSPSITACRIGNRRASWAIDPNRAVQSLPRREKHVRGAVTHVELRAIAVHLDLVDPLIAARWLLVLRRMCWFDEAGKGRFSSAWNSSVSTGRGLWPRNWHSLLR